MQKNEKKCKAWVEKEARVKGEKAVSVERKTW